MSGCCIRKALTRKSINSAEGLSPDSKELLQELDALTVSLSTSLPGQFIKANEDPYTDDDIVTAEIDLAWKKTGPAFDDWKRVPVKDFKYQVSKSFKTTVLREDDLFGKYTVLEQLGRGALRSPCLFPMKDKIVWTDSPKLLEELKLEEGQAMPTSYNTDFNMQSDRSFSRIFFYGLGATLLVDQTKPSDTPELGPFVVDLLPLEKLKTRPGFMKYGCRIYFSEDQLVSAIVYGGKKVLPGSKGWDIAKWVAKVNTFFFVTAREHLLWTHLILGNMSTLASTLKLKPSHPIRRLLTIFTFRTTEVNTNAFDSLVPKLSLLHRASGLEYEGMKQTFELAFLTCNIYKPFPDQKVIPELLELSDDGKFPFLSEGAAYFEIVRKFVRSWLEHAGDAVNDEEAKVFYNSIKRSTEAQAYVLPDLGEKDSMVNLLSQIIFVVTAYHELVGHVVDYTVGFDRAGFRVVEGNSKVDVQSGLLTALIAAATSLRMPSLMSAFSNFFGEGGGPSWERDVWNSFVKDLEKQSKKVRKADDKRSDKSDVEFKYFDPARFECSVSV